MNFQDGEKAEEKPRLNGLGYLFGGDRLFF